MTNPFAQAAQQLNTQNTGTQPDDSSTPGKPVSNPDNPFMKASDVTPAGGGGGKTWDPRVPFDYLDGRMIVMVPKSLKDDALVPTQFGGDGKKTREEYRVDIVILDGDAFDFTYNDRANGADGKWVQNPDGSYVTEEKTFSVTQFPATFREQTVAQGQLIRALKGADAAGAFLYGVLRRVPTAADARTGMTIEKLEEKLTQWRQRVAAGDPRAGERPRHTWGLDDRPQALTPQRVELSMKWWEDKRREEFAAASGK